jgi:membrane protein
MSIFQVIHTSIKDYKNYNPLALASSTAFFTLFALPPILIIISKVLGTFTTPDLISGELFGQLSSYFGDKTANQIKVVFENFQSIAHAPLTSILVFVFMMFVATTLFKMIKDSINLLWGFKPKANQPFLTAIFERLLSFILLNIAGVIFLFSLVSDTFLTFLGSFVAQYNPDWNILLIKSINALFSILSISLWFSLLFKVLPNANIKMKPALIGGFFTAILFTIGKFILGRVLISSNIDSIFGASGSVVLLLLFVFYSSLIFYFGAVFTSNYAAAINQEVKPGFYAVKVNTSEVKL